jgi:ABC-type transporter Mla MlaB component
LAKTNDEHENRQHRGQQPIGVVDIDVSWLVPADLAAVDALARLQVVASRCGRLLQFHGAAGGLAELVDFVGMKDVVHLCSCCRSTGSSP